MSPEVVRVGNDTRSQGNNVPNRGALADQARMILRRKQLGGFGDGVGGALTAGVTTAFREFCEEGPVSPESPLGRLAISRARETLFLPLSKYALFEASLDVAEFDVHFPQGDARPPLAWLSASGFLSGEIVLPVFIRPAIRAILSHRGWTR